jgi:hypothetical protein
VLSTTAQVKEVVDGLKEAKIFTAIRRSGPSFHKPAGPRFLSSKAFRNLPQIHRPYYYDYFL